MSEMAIIRAPWPPESPVRGFSTTRTGGVSPPPWASLNLGSGSDDASENLSANRRRLQSILPARPCWLKQVHGTRVIHLSDWEPGIEADAAWTDQKGVVAAVLTADCLPVLMADEAGTVVAAAHAGWRGLAAGVLQNTVAALPVTAGSLTAWIGPAISVRHYEVGPEVREAFRPVGGALEHGFHRGEDGRYMADLPGIARLVLESAGVGRVVESGLCTAEDPDQFYSFRREGVTGRMASLIWLQ